MGKTRRNGKRQKGKNKAKWEQRKVGRHSSKQQTQRQLPFALDNLFYPSAY
jgi:hypothetical protein